MVLLLSVDRAAGSYLASRVTPPVARAQGRHVTVNGGRLAYRPRMHLTRVTAHDARVMIALDVIGSMDMLCFTVTIVITRGLQRQRWSSEVSVANSGPTFRVRDHLGTIGSDMLRAGIAAHTETEPISGCLIPSRGRTRVTRSDG
jgi:hypothetical protein